MSGKAVILANPKGKAWDFACSIYENLRKRNDSFELIELEIKKFRDCEIKPKIKENVREKKCFFIHDSSLMPNEWFLELVLVNEALKNSSALKIVDVLPYLKFSRQDRKDESRVPITAKVIADCINLYSTNVLTIDVHSPQIQGFYNIPLDNLYSFSIVINYLKEKHPEILKEVVIMSPDAGGAARAKAFAKRLGMEEVVVGYKTRKVEGEVESFKILGDVNGKNVLIVDDIVDSGNTLIKACQALRQEGANKVYAYCTHGLFTEGVEKITNCFDYVFVGDTIARENQEKLEVVSFADLFAEAIYRISKGESLSELFD